MLARLFESYLFKLLSTMCVSMVPVVELRGALPYGIALGLNPWVSFAVSVVGNLIPVPFILLLIRYIFNWLRTRNWWGPKIEWLERKGHLKGRIVTKYRTLGLILLVAIPLPGTGAWTGALVAALLNIRLRTAVPAILLGVVIAGLIVLGVSYGLVSFL